MMKRNQFTYTHTYTHTHTHTYTHTHTHTHTHTYKILLAPIEPQTLGYFDKLLSRVHAFISSSKVL